MLSARDRHRLISPIHHQLLDLRGKLSLGFGVNISAMDQALARWRRSYNVEDDAFESLMGIISMQGPATIPITEDGTEPYLRGIPPDMSSHYLVNDFRDTTGATRAPLMAGTASSFLQPCLDAIPMQDMATEADPFMSYVSPIAAPLSNETVLQTVQDFSQSMVAVSPKTPSRSCVKC